MSIDLVQQIYTQGLADKMFFFDNDVFNYKTKCGIYPLYGTKVPVVYTYDYYRKVVPIYHEDFPTVQIDKKIEYIHNIVIGYLDKNSNVRLVTIKAPNWGQFFRKFRPSKYNVGSMSTEHKELLWRLRHVRLTGTTKFLSRI